MAQDYQLPADQADSQTAFLNKVNEAAAAQRSSFGGTTAPTDPAPVAGQLWFNTSTEVLSAWDGTSWEALAVLSGGIVQDRLLYWNGSVLIGLALSASEVPIGVSGAPPIGGGINDIAGPLNANRGGTGLTSVTQGDLLYYNSGTDYSKLAKDTNATRYLSNTGASNNPAWAQINLANGTTGTLGAASIDPAVSRTTTQVIGFATVAAASSGVGTTATLTIPFGARGVLQGGVVKVKTAFAGPGIANEIYLDIPNTAAGNPLIQPTFYDVTQAVSGTNFVVFTGLNVGLFLIEDYAGWNLTLVFTPNGAEDLANLNAGELEVSLTTMTIPA